MLRLSIHKLRAADYATLANILCGVGAVYLSFSDKLTWAAVLVLAGVALDKLDGFVAKKLSQQSEFGAELDSLADIVTFGVATSVLLFVYLQGTSWAIVPLLLPVFGALRLARFNVARHQEEGFFTGVPITITGLVFPILVLCGVPNMAVVVGVIVMSLLMVSNLKIKKFL
ncbi:MAG TPA: CDP-diacylglycerol--serine O-phosphatidyltransferase [Patescibacteria group bacterium]|nr:CDP-diacylglycerol--serine O-phosphatidyltransferase [Patescibacteria group bacterium]